ncbi:MAG TPA: signal recognition particle protein, partial [Methylomirabilota bacterium]|nr:signal recognition particle protein [Methylomirabilota bacterium]
ALDYAKRHYHDVLIIDTAGRLGIDEAMMQEIAALHAAVKPIETLFVVDAMQGQDAVNTAKAFRDALPLTGVVLTKLDGDARGGAALSIGKVTGAPVKFAGIGEKYDALEAFYPERIVSRVLGMGDVLTLIEKVEQAVDTKKVAELERKLRRDEFTLEDFRDQLRQLRKMGPLEQVLDMLPKVGPLANLPKDAHVDEGRLKRVEAIINSMTGAERDDHSIIDGKRRKRIARGSGTSVQEVNQVLKQYMQMRKMIKQFGPAAAKGKLRGLGKLSGLG